MLVALHAFALTVAPLATIATLLLTRRRQPNSRGITISGLIAAGTSFLVYSLNLHMCQSGTPGVQCVLVGCCLWVLLAYVGNLVTRIGSFAIGTILMVALSAQYVSLVHTNDWTGNPSLGRAAISVRNTSALKAIGAEIKAAPGSESTEYAAGWVHELPIAASLKADTYPQHLYRVEVGRAWHSWFTRLYPTRRIPQDFWYPGGKIADAADRIELRDLANSAEARSTRPAETP